ncbi:MAG TPA: glycoside hydrolase family 15 protein [Thermomicrobiaceae bacterium]|nr:glycoside hydrolase family 15 protein [Thermomicrobiaceae bacterium]
MDPRVTHYLPIKDYGLIGDCHSAALVSREGSIDWLCMPRFDSPSVFARILDYDKGGYWSIEPTSGFQSTHAYIPNTNVLETHLTTNDGEARILDFMPIRLKSPAPTLWTAQSLYRVVEGLSGQVTVASVCAPRPEYASRRPSFQHEGKQVFFGDFLLIGPGPWQVDPGRGAVSQRVTLKAGDRVAFGLHDIGDRSALTKAPPDPFTSLESTLTYWKTWASRCTYTGPYREQVVRSALALRMLHYTPTGAIVAAPTTSLPEEIGGQRNWDYRFAWLRDAAFTLYALLLAGYTEESGAFFSWILDVVKLDKTGLRILYPITRDGETVERTLDYLEGYRASRPVRVGNGAVNQLQLDVFGEVFDALYFAWKVGKYDPHHVWTHFQPLADWVAKNWQLPGSGIWEIRGGPRHFVYGKVMCWVALDRAIKLAEAEHLPGDVAGWRKERDQIRQAVLLHGWSDRLHAFKQSFEEDCLDAANLRMSLVGFIDGTDPRMLATIDAIQQHLLVDGLCYRYLGIEDGVPGGESTFVLCTFWLINALLLAKRDDEAQELYEQLLAQGTDLGLLSEEISVASGEFLGNYPQAFSQIGVISAAVSLAHEGQVGSVPAQPAEKAANARLGDGQAQPNLPVKSGASS